MPIFRGGPKRPDILVGTNKKDTLRGKGEDDVLLGRGQNDRLFGDEGDDLLFADRGRDFLTGGTGADRFSILDARQRDVIRDFDRSEDVLDLSVIGASRPGQITFTRLEADAVLVEFKAHSIRVEGDFSIKQLQRAIDYADKLVLDFEQLRLDKPLVANGNRLDDGKRFAGFNWDATGVVDVPRANRQDASGHVATSGRTAVYVNVGSAIYDDEPFKFHAAQASGAWRDGVTLEVQGFLRGVSLGVQRFRLGDAGEVERLRFDDDIFSAVDEVRFNVSGGTTNPDTTFDGLQVSLDDIVIFV